MPSIDNLNEDTSAKNCPFQPSTRNQILKYLFPNSQDFSLSTNALCEFVKNASSDLTYGDFKLNTSDAKELEQLCSALNIVTLSTPSSNNSTNEDASSPTASNEASIFNVSIYYSNNQADYLDLQVTQYEMVQEIHQILMEREETYSKTCFSLYHKNVRMDQFSELKSVSGLGDDSNLKLVEEPYTLREVRLHLKHLRDILNTLDLTDAFNGNEGASVTYVDAIIGNDNLTKFIDMATDKVSNPSSLNRSSSIWKKINRENTACLEESVVDETLRPPEYLLPEKDDEAPLTALHPLDLKEKPICCLKSISFNHWNPPPGPRKLKGDLAYMTLMTLENKQFHITACNKGFYINLSSCDTFDPRPNVEFQTHHSLFDLIAKVSPSFKKNIAILVKKRFEQNTLEKTALPIPKYCWILPFLEHKEDAYRAEDMMEIRLGFEDQIPGQTRDWNEELQATRELPRTDLLARVSRDRAIFKVGSDFVNAVVKGALALSYGNTLPINPAEAPKMHMYIWNYIFYSLGFDIRDHYKEIGGDEAAHVAPVNDLKGVELYSDLDMEHLCTIGTVVIDYRGSRITGQTIIPGILEREQEELVVYGSIDPTPTPSSNATSSGCNTNNATSCNNSNSNNCPYAAKKRVSPSSQDNQSDDIMLHPPTQQQQKEGSSPASDVIIIKTHPKYDELLREAAKKLRIRSHRICTPLYTTPKNDSNCSVDIGTMVDGSPNESNYINETVELHTSYECKGITGNDQRNYLLDLYRTLPPDMNYIPVKEYKISHHISRKFSLPPANYKHQLACLRPELIEAFTEYVILIKNNTAAVTPSSAVNDVTDVLSVPIFTTSKGESSMSVDECHRGLLYDDESVQDIVAPRQLKSGETSLSGDTLNCLAAATATHQDCDGKSTGNSSHTSEDKDSAIESMDLPSPDGISSDDEETTASRQLSHQRDDKSASYRSSKMRFRLKFPVLLDDLRFNPDAFLDIVKHAVEDGAKLKIERELLMDAADFLTCHQLPDLLDDLIDHTSIPMDGEALVELMHAKGINVRYLGILLKMIEINEACERNKIHLNCSSADRLVNLKYLKNIIKTELVSRGVKHIFRKLLQDIKTAEHLSPAIARFLNSYLGYVPSYESQNGSVCNTVASNPQTHQHSFEASKNVIKKKGKKKKGSNNGNQNHHSHVEQNTEWATFNSQSLWQRVVADIEANYLYKLSEPQDSFYEYALANGLKKSLFLRQFCLKCGVQIVLREYRLNHHETTNCPDAVVNGKPCVSSQDSEHPFNPSSLQIYFIEDDVINLFPRIKIASHKANDAHNFFIAAQTKIQQGSLKEGFELLSESLNLMNTVYGPLHSEITSCLRLIARLCYILGDKLQALSFQHKSTIMSERLHGLDHSNTIVDYINLALYYVANYRIGVALRLLYRARYLLLIIAESDHPEFISLDSNLGLVLYANGMHDESMKYLENALSLSTRYYGENCLKTAIIYHLIAGVYSCKGDFRTAITVEKKAFSVYKELLGENHEKTLESGACLRHLTQQAVAMQKCILRKPISQPENLTKNNEHNKKKTANTPNPDSNFSHHGNGFAKRFMGSSNSCNSLTNILTSLPYLPSLQIQKPSLNAILDLMNVINGILFVQIKPYELDKLSDSERNLIFTTTKRF